MAFYPLSQLAGAAFLVFVVFETTAMVAALAMHGAAQTSHLTACLLVPFDHKGAFHLIQLVAAIMLATGLRRGFAAS